MGILTNITNFFQTKENETYLKAKELIHDAKQKINSFIVVFPDATISEMVFIKNRWKSLPIKFGEGVSILSLNISDNYKLLITHFSSGGYLSEHEHTNNYELNRVIAGSIIDEINNKTYTVGDEFIIDRNTKHTLFSKGESFLITVFSTNKDELIIPNNINLEPIKYNKKLLKSIHY